MKNFKDYLKETVVQHGAPQLTAKLTAVADALYALGTKDATHHANKFYDFVEAHQGTSYPEGDLKSLKDDAVYYGKKWGHIVNKRAVDKLGTAIIALKNGETDDTIPETDDISNDPTFDMSDDTMDMPIEEEAEYDYGTDDYYDINTKTFKTGEFVDKGKGSLKQAKNNPRFGDNSLEDDTLNEDGNFDPHQTLDLDKLQELLNNAGVSDDEIIAGIGGIQTEAKTRVAHALGVDPEKIDFMVNELSTKLSKDDDKNYEMFTEDYFAEEYERIMEEDERFGYQQDSSGNIEISDTVTGKHVYLQGTEAQEILHKLAITPQHAQHILAGYESVMESEEKKFVISWERKDKGSMEAFKSGETKVSAKSDKEARNKVKDMFKDDYIIKIKDSNLLSEDKKWKAGGKNDIKQSVSKNVKEESKLKTDPEKPKLKPPFENTKKIVKKKVKPVTESAVLDEDDSFMQEIHSDGGSYNFPWKSDGHTGTGTASFKLSHGTPMINVISVRNAQGDEISDYDSTDMLAQAKKFIPDA